MFAASAQAGGPVRYVDASAPPGGNGLSWATAYRSLQTAVTSSPVDTTIHVAAGTYKPAGVNGDRWAAFALKIGMALYGGYPVGGGEPEDRDPFVHITTLSGDLNDDDGPNFANNDENTYRIIQISNSGSDNYYENMVVDGFRIIGGNANASLQNVEGFNGGAVYHRLGSLTIENCVFDSNASSQGGAIALYGVHLTMTNCIVSNSAEGGVYLTVADVASQFDITGSASFSDCDFTNNSSSHGAGAISLHRADSSFSNCHFTANSAIHANGKGGAISSSRENNAAEIHPLLAMHNCTFTNNMALHSGGAVYHETTNFGPVNMVTNCQFSGNSSGSGPGGAYFGGKAHVSDCQFVNNSSQTSGAGAMGVSGVVVDCTFTGNSSMTEAGALQHGGENPGDGVYNCYFENNHATDSSIGCGGAATFGGAALIAGCDFVGNSAGARGGAADLDGLTVMENCAFENNAAPEGGACWTGAHPTVRDCAFQNNDATLGGALFVHRTMGGLIGPFVIDNIFLDNSSTSHGGAVYLEGFNKSQVFNCRFHGNTAGGSGGGIAVHFSAIQMRIVGSIFTGNAASVGGGIATLAGGGGGDQISNCTVVANTATSTTGGISNLAPHTDIRNCIIVGNTDSGSDLQAAQFVTAFDPQNTDIEHNCVEGWTGAIAGINNFDADPMFVDRDGADDILGTLDDDARLLSNSPCNNAGTNDGIAPDIADLDSDLDAFEPFPFDADGNVRIKYVVVDRGAYEHPNSSGGAGQYIGPTGGTWFDTAHWQGSALPSPGTIVFIDDEVIVNQIDAAAMAVIVQAGGHLIITNGGSLLSAAGLVVENGGSVTVSDGTLSTPAGSVDIEGGGSLALGGATAALEIYSGQIDAGAAVSLEGGLLRLLGGALVSQVNLALGCTAATELNLVSPSLVEAPQLEVCSNGLLSGCGTIVATVQNQGTISPGDSVGSISIVGDLVQGNTGTLSFEIDAYAKGATRDTLTVGGVATLNGTVLVSVDDESTVEVCHFDVLTANSVKGTFATQTLPDPPDVYLCTVTQTSDVVTVATVLPGPRLYVGALKIAGGAGIGESWGTAMPSLSDALEAARYNPAIDEIWVAAGVYTPTEITNPADAIPERSATYQLVTDLSVYGGFAGTEGSIAERDLQTNVTILEGDREGNDTPNFDNRFDNIRQMITAAGVTNALMDGFTVQNGEASIFYYSGGLSVQNSESTLSNMTFRRNRAIGSSGSGGGGVDVLDSEVVITSCLLEENNLGLAAGNSVLEISNSEFATNLGGMAIHSSNLLATSVLFQGNEGGVQLGGGAVVADEQAAALFANCQFVGNLSGGAAAVYAKAATLEFVECVFEGNLPSEFSNGGGAARIDSGTITVTGCEFIDNLGAHPALSITQFAHATISGCLFEGNAGRGLAIAMGPGSFVGDCDFITNSGINGAGLSVSVSHPVDEVLTIANCSFVGNIAFNPSNSEGDGGGVQVGTVEFDPAGPLRFLNCSFEGNSAEGEGGAIATSGDAYVHLDGCTFLDDSAPLGAGMFVSARDVVTGIESSFAGTSDLDCIQSISPGGPFSTSADLIGEFSIASTMRLLNTPGSASASPTLVIDILGTASADFDRINATTGAAELDGALVVNVLDGFTPSVGDTFDFLMSPSATGSFKTAAMPPLTGGLVTTIDYHAAGVSLVVGTEATIGADHPTLTSTQGTLADQVVADFDHDGDSDVAVYLRSTPVGNKLFVFRNNGTDSAGNWLGFTVEQQSVLSLTVPAHMVGGDFNGDTFLDLAIYDNLGVILIALNDGIGSATFATGSFFAVPSNATRIATGSFNAGGTFDIAVLDAVGESVRVYFNSGAAVFAAGPVITGQEDALDLAVADMNLDGAADIVVSRGGTNPHLSTRLAQPATSTFSTPVSRDLPLALDKILVQDLNYNAFPDLIGTSAANGALLLLSNSCIGDGRLDSVCRVPATTTPGPLSAIDLDDDGDLDVLVLDQTVPGFPSVHFARNNLTTGGTIALAGLVELITDQPAKLLSSGVINDDSVGDVIVTAQNANMTDVYVFLGTPVLLGACSTDIVSSTTFQPPGDGAVNAADLAFLLGEWGVNPESLADFVSSATFQPPPDGVVNAADLAFLLGEWGPCN